MRHKKFNFSKIMFNGWATDSVNVPTLSIGRNGQMVISKVANHKFGLDNMLVDILWDAEKKALGFRRMNGVNLSEDKYTKTMRMLKAEENGSIKVSVGKIMTALGIPKENYKKLPIEAYADIMESREILYVIIPSIKKDETLL